MKQLLQDWQNSFCRLAILFMHRHLHRVLLFHFLEILTHRVMDLCRFHQWLTRNAAKSAPFQT
jgi:hypothetical protein